MGSCAAQVRFQGQSGHVRQLKKPCRMRLSRWSRDRMEAIPILLRGSQLSRANGSAHAELFSIDMLPVSAIGLRMVAAANLVEVAALVGDTARATMLNALLGGQSLTATELAYCANVSRSTASGHLSKLVAARLLTVAHKRRFSYYRIASPLV